MTIRHLLWGDVLSAIQVEIGNDEFGLWLNSVRIVSVEDGVATIGAPSTFLANLLQRKFSRAFRKHLSDHLGQEVDVKFVADESLLVEAVTVAAPESEKETSRKARARRNRECRFDSFITEEGNHLAWSACRSIGEQFDGEHNPTVIYGSSGTGKTHLLLALRSRLRERVRGVGGGRYLSGEQLTNEYFAAVRGKTLPAFRQTVRNMDCILLDDLRVAAGKPAFQRELVRSFDEWMQKDAQIVIAMHCHPRHWQALSPALRTRLSSGLVIQMKEPGLDSRLRIIAARALERGLHLPDAVMQVIAERLPTGVRELEGLLHKLHAYSTISGGRVRPDHVAAILDACHATAGRRTTLARIVKVLMEEYRISRDELLSSRRTRRTVQVRRIGMYLARELSGYSFKEIGEYFGNRRHSTVMAAVEQVRQTMGNDDAYHAEVHRLMDGLRRAEP